MANLARTLLRPWAIPLGISIISVLIASLDASEALQYHRAAILQGDLSRLLSGHFVHLDTPHLLLNLAALAVIWELFFCEQKQTPLLWPIAILCVATSLMLLGFNPALQWYVGLSGILHGLFVWGVVSVKGYSTVLRTLLLVGVAVKLGLEWWLGGLSSNWLDNAVVTEAHFYGAISGVGVALLRLLPTRLFNNR